MAISQRFQSGRQVPFSDEELFAHDFPATKTGKYQNDIAIPLGGIGLTAFRYQAAVNFASGRFSTASSAAKPALNARMGMLSLLSHIPSH